VREEKELHLAYATAQTEAQNAFGNPTLYLEKYFENPRHIEVQLVATARAP